MLITFTYWLGSYKVAACKCSSKFTQTCILKLSILKLHHPLLLLEPDSLIMMTNQEDIGKPKANNLSVTKTLTTGLLTPSHV